jgi:hypothetical protein
MRRSLEQGGATIIELTLSLAVFMIIAIGMFSLLTYLQQSSLIGKQKAVASTLATNQMESLKSLPYDSLVIAGGSIYSPTPLPATRTDTLNGTTYTTKTSINYVDDAYDGCANYPNLQLKMQYCRNYPPPSGAPATDTNPQDYKVIHVTVSSKVGKELAAVDTQISARVSETASTTGALFVKVIDESGNPVSGATTNVVNNTVSPAVNLSDTSDGNGISIFYGLPVDNNNFDFQITSSLTGYSTLTTIIPSGSLQPTYPSQKILSQQSSYVTLTIKPQGTDSLLIETTGVDGSALPNAKIYIKGGYKKYTDSNDTKYYYDTLSPSDTRPQSDASGLVGVSNLNPGDYIFCGDTGATSCVIGGTTYYLVAAVPYGGVGALNPITVPTYRAASPPATTYPFGGKNYLQKVRLMLTTSSTYPRAYDVSPYDVSLAAGGLSNFVFTITGANLPCNANAASCNTVVKLTQGATVITASCTGAAVGIQLNCTANITPVTTGTLQVSITANGNTLTLPVGGLLGGIVVKP